jgi:CBS domain-containing protein
MWDYDCGVLPVIDDAERVMGLITDRDIASAAATNNRPASAITVGEVISGNVYACAEDDDIKAALRTMQQKGVRRLPVVGQDGNWPASSRSMTLCCALKGPEGNKRRKSLIVTSSARLRRCANIREHIRLVCDSPQQRKVMTDKAAFTFRRQRLSAKSVTPAGCFF